MASAWLAGGSNRSPIHSPLTVERAALRVAEREWLLAPRTGPIGRETPLPVALQAALFEIDSGTATTAADAKRQSHFVAQLTEIRSADAKADKQVRERLAGQLADAFGSDLINQYRERLYDQIGVSINNAAFAAVTDGI